MKLEYLAHGSPDCPLIRLYDFADQESNQLAADLGTLCSKVHSAASAKIWTLVIHGARLEK